MKTNAEYCRIWRENHPERAAASSRKYRISEHGKTVLKTYYAREDVSKRTRARNLVRNLIFNGKLSRQPCEVCNSPNAQAHHEDYNFPLQITWLCNRDHLKRHGKKQV